VQDQHSSNNDGVQFERLRARLPEAPPPWTRRRMVVVPAIVAINVVVFLAWQVANGGGELLRFMVSNFLVSTGHLAGGPLRVQVGNQLVEGVLSGGAYWTLLTSVFSHNFLWHILVNMFVLWSFGSIMERLLGSAKFAAFYLASGVFASAAHCAVSAFMGRGQVPALGASGAVAAVLMAYALTFPKHRILLFGVVPMPALGGVLLFVGFDIWGLIAQGQGGGLPIGHGAHLGGALAGALFWWLQMRDNPPDTSPAPRTEVGRLGLDADEALEFDRLRRKLSIEGPGSLTDQERLFLQRVRDRALN
jgi:membrane associated rhomboid family serine protease